PLGWGLVLGVLAFWGLTAAPAGAQPQAAEKPKVETPVTKGEGIAPKIKLSEKKVAFEMRNAPWSKVMEWLGGQTGLQFTGKINATGTFNYIGPQTIGKEPKKLSIPEVIDIINETLLSENYLLIRREASFMIVAADTKIDPILLKTVSAADLPEH